MRHIFKEIKDFERQVKHETEAYIEKPKEKPSFTEIQIIGFLFKNEGKVIYQKDIVEELNLKKNSVTDRLDLMEEKGIIHRINDENDSRKKRIILSEKSIEKRNELINIFDDIEKKATLNIDQKKIDIFFEVLDEMKKNLERK